MADSDSDNEVPAAGRERRGPVAEPRARRQRAVPIEEAVAEPAEPVAAPRARRQRAAPLEEPVAEPAEPVAAPRARRQRAVPIEEPVAEPAEPVEVPSGAPRRSARKPRAKSVATKRRNLRESRRVLAQSGINAENDREGGEEGGEVAEERREAPEEGGEAPEEGPLGMIGAMLQKTVNYLKTDPYENAFGNDISEEPYPSLKELYETAKENPDSAETLRQVTSDFRSLKQGYHNAGCDTDINISMNPKCLGVQAGLYMRLFDIRKSIDDSLEQMKPIQQQAILARINREARPEYNGEEDVFVPAGV
jgi:hypothetical protein